MANPPGPTGTATNTPGIDGGTLVRTASPAVGPVDTEGSSQPARQPCTGREVTTIAGLGAIPSYRGDFPSPLQVMWYTPTPGEPLRMSVPDSEIRQWIKQAAQYQRIPHVLLAVVLQQENSPRATGWHQFLQFGERSLTTAAAIADEALFDIVPDRVAGSSTGFANMSRAALRDAVAYSQRMYGRPPMPADVRYRLLGWDQDTRVSGDDLRGDLYYCAAHLRQLVDRVAGRCHNGALTLDQLERVIKAYNGSGPLADKYARDAMKLLADAQTGAATLYFYEE